MGFYGRLACLPLAGGVFLSKDPGFQSLPSPSLISDESTFPYTSTPLSTGQGKEPFYRHCELVHRQAGAARQSACSLAEIASSPHNDESL